MRKTWTEQGWDDYVYWQMQDKKTLRRINDLVKDIERNGLSSGIGKPLKAICKDFGRVVLMIKIAWSIISQKMVRYVLLPVVDTMNENIKDVEIAWGTVPIRDKDKGMV